MADEGLLLQVLAEMTASSLEHAALDDRDIMLVRLAGLAAVDAPAGSYLMNLNAAADAGLTLEDARGVLIAIAPVIGTPKVIAATGKIAEALGFALDVADAIERAE